MKKLILLAASVIGLNTISNAQCVPDIITGLVAEYNFSGNANDISGNGYNGTVYNVTLTKDRFGNPNSAYYFDGTNSYIDVPNNNALNCTTNNAISISFWAVLDTTTPLGTSSVLISKQSGSGNTQTGYDIEQYGGASFYNSIRVGTSGGNYAGGSTDVTPSLFQWHHFVFTYNGTTGVSTGYVDGTLEDSTGGSSAIIGSDTYDLLIGMANWSNINTQNFKGDLDDIRIYNRILNRCDIEDLYTLPNPIASCNPNITNGLIASYDFFGNADDTSGNGNNGVDYGASLTTDRFGNPHGAFNFNGTSDSIVIPNSSSLQFSSDNQSISFWMDLASIPNPSNQDEGIIYKANQNLDIDATGSSTQGTKISFQQSGNGTITYALSGGGNDWATTTINNSYLNTNQWMFLAFTYDNSKDSIFAYFNGVKVNSAVKNTTGSGIVSSGNGIVIGANTMPLLIGKSDWISNGIPAYLFTGKLSDVRIYDTPLSACDVDSLYNMPNPVTTGIAAIGGKNNNIAVYPNPTNGNLTISGVNAGDFIEVYTSMGQKIETKIANTTTLNMDISAQANGIYLTRIIRKDGSSGSQRVIIKTN